MLLGYYKWPLHFGNVHHPWPKNIVKHEVNVIMNLTKCVINEVQGEV